MSLRLQSHKILYMKHLIIKYILNKREFYQFMKHLLFRRLLNMTIIFKWMENQSLIACLLKY